MIVIYLILLPTVIATKECTAGGPRKDSGRSGEHQANHKDSKVLAMGYKEACWDEYKHLTNSRRETEQGKTAIFRGYVMFRPLVVCCWWSGPG